MTKFKLIHDGPALLVRNNKTSIQVHLVYVEGILFLFHKESDKYVLKYFQSSANANIPLTPIIKLSHLIVRPNAAGEC